MGMFFQLTSELFNIIKIHEAYNKHFFINSQGKFLKFG